MITIKDFELKSEMSEFTIGQFEDLSNVLNGDLDYIDKYLEIMRMQGMPETTIDLITDNDLFDYIKALISDKEVSTEMKNYAFVDGYEYLSYEKGGEFVLKAKDLGMIEKQWKKSPSFSMAIATLFKRTDLTSTEHYTQAHIDYKSKLFRDLPVVDYYAYIVHISDALGKKIKMLHDNANKED